MKKEDNGKVLSDEAVFKEKIKDLKKRLIHLYTFVPRLRQCSHLSDLIEEVFELREGLNQFEQGILEKQMQNKSSDCYSYKNRKYFNDSSC